MSFLMYERDSTGKIKTDKEGNPKYKRNRVTLDCSCDEGRTEQSHKAEVDINNIVKKHGADLIRKTTMLAGTEFQFDDVSGNDFQEAAFKIAKAEQSFNSMPSQLRAKFNNNPAEFLDYVQNPKNADEMVELGLAVKREENIQKVVITNESLATKPVVENESNINSENKGVD